MRTTNALVMSIDKRVENFYYLKKSKRIKTPLLKDGQLAKSGSLEVQKKLIKIKIT